MSLSPLLLELEADSFILLVEIQDEINQEGFISLFTGFVQALFVITKWVVSDGGTGKNIDATAEHII